MNRREYHFAILYSIAILNVLPAKGVHDKNDVPTCPHALAFGKRPKIGNFRVFGCPAAIKHYTATTSHGTPKTEMKDDFRPTPKHVQQAIRGIFIGFPETQAGWLFYLPQGLGTHNFIVSRNAVFDESFESTLAHAKPPYSGAMPERANLPLMDTIHIHETHTPLQSTGTVADFPFRHSLLLVRRGNLNKT